jgi:hypothetical protein
MEYEATDQAANQHVVHCRRGSGCRLYLTADGLGTDRPERAMRYRDCATATAAARAARDEPGWRGFFWVALPAIGLPPPVDR